MIKRINSTHSVRLPLSAIFFLHFSHIRIHTGDKPFVCSYPNCTYAFRASGDLYKHVRRHTATDDATSRPHICDDCGRGFERGYDLKRHVLTHKKHDENVGYKCTHCPKRFFRKVSKSSIQCF